MNNEFEKNNNMNSQYSNNYNDLDNPNNNKSGNNGLTIALIFIIVALAGLCLYLVLDKKDGNVDSKLNYEIKLVEGNKELYVNNNKVNGIKADNELGSLDVKEFNNLLIVDEQNPGPSRRLLVVDKNGNATEIDYKISAYSSDLRNRIDSYRIENNNLYIKVERFKDGYVDWYCHFDNKNDIAEYEVKYEYVNGKLGNRQVLNEVTIAIKYQNEKCNTELNYEVKEEEDSSTGAKWYYLYVNNSKVNNIKAYEEHGSIEVKEFNNLLIVDEYNPGAARRLLVVDKNGNATEIDYKVSTYSSELRNRIDSYRIENNNLYIKVNRQWGNGYIDWYCYFDNKNDIAEYEVKYEYVNGKLGNRQVLNEVRIDDKYKNEKCMNNSVKICNEYRDVIYENSDYNLKLILTKDRKFTFYRSNVETLIGDYTLSNNLIALTYCSTDELCDEKEMNTYDISSDCSSIIWDSHILDLIE